MQGQAFFPAAEYPRYEQPTGGGSRSCEREICSAAMWVVVRQDCNTAGLNGVGHRSAHNLAHMVCLPARGVIHSRGASRRSLCRFP
jgi:hypothetical protein